MCHSEVWFLFYVVTITYQLRGKVSSCLKAVLPILWFLFTQGRLSSLTEPLLPKICLTPLAKESHALSRPLSFFLQDEGKRNLPVGDILLPWHSLWWYVGPIYWLDGNTETANSFGNYGPVYSHLHWHVFKTPTTVCCRFYSLLCFQKDWPDIVNYCAALHLTHSSFPHWLQNGVLWGGDVYSIGFANSLSKTCSM